MSEEQSKVDELNYVKSVIEVFDESLRPLLLNVKGGIRFSIAAALIDQIVCTLTMSQAIAVLEIVKCSILSGYFSVDKPPDKGNGS